MRILAVDLGKTGCRAAAWLGGARQDADGPGAPGLAFAGGVEAAEAAILAVVRDFGRIGRVCVGAAGALADPAAADGLAWRLHAALGADEVAVTSDAVTAHAGALGGGPGVVLTAGTGAVAVAAGPGTFVRVDGWGPWLGDDGSGGAIGLAGLRAVLRATDGRGPVTALAAAAASCFGVEAAGLPGLIGRSAHPAREAARFAGPVVAAAGNGDAVATCIVEDAVAALVRTVEAAMTRSGVTTPAPLVLAGGVLRTGAALADRLHRALACHRIVPAVGTALDGARLLSARFDTFHERHIVRVRNGLSRLT